MKFKLLAFIFITFIASYCLAASNDPSVEVNLEFLEVIKTKKTTKTTASYEIEDSTPTSPKNESTPKDSPKANRIKSSPVVLYENGETPRAVAKTIKTTKENAEFVPKPQYKPTFSKSKKAKSEKLDKIKPENNKKKETSKKPQKDSPKKENKIKIIPAERPKKSEVKLEQIKVPAMPAAQPLVKPDSSKLETIDAKPQASPANNKIISTQELAPIVEEPKILPPTIFDSATGLTQKIEQTKVNLEQKDKKKNRLLEQVDKLQKIKQNGN